MKPRPPWGRKQPNAAPPARRPEPVGIATLSAIAGVLGAVPGAAHNPGFGFADSRPLPTAAPDRGPRAAPARPAHLPRPNER